MASVFTKILNNELPSYKLYEDEYTMAILALNQIQLGHTLVISKKEENHFFDLEDKEYIALMMTTKKLAKAIKKATGCNRVCTFFQGFEVQHVHHHLVPTQSAKDFNLSMQIPRSPEDMKFIQDKIIAALGEI
jgi:histidine triad (HIT) family protein